jgi:hypothetical protein
MPLLRNGAVERFEHLSLRPLPHPSLLLVWYPSFLHHRGNESFEPESDEEDENDDDDTLERLSTELNEDEIRRMKKLALKDFPFVAFRLE